MSSLVGSWRFVRGMNDGRAMMPNNLVILKHVTGAHFTVVRYKADTKAVTAVHGGTCSSDHGSYTEMTTYGVGPTYEQVNNKPQIFRSKV